MKHLVGLFLALATLVTPADAQSVIVTDAKPLGVLKNSFRVQGQFYGSERQHFYAFTLGEGGCIQIGNLGVSKTLRVAVRDAGGGEVQNTLLQPLSRRTTPPGGMVLKLLPADYVVHIEHFRRTDSAAVYEIAVQRAPC